MLHVTLVLKLCNENGNSREKLSEQWMKGSLANFIWDAKPEFKQDVHNDNTIIVRSKTNGNVIGTGVEWISRAL